jgi:hypothetical protein
MSNRMTEAEQIATRTPNEIRNDRRVTGACPGAR